MADGLQKFISECIFLNCFLSVNVMWFPFLYSLLTVFYYVRLVIACNYLIEVFYYFNYL